MDKEDYEEWFEENEGDLKFDFVDDELSEKDCKKIIGEDFLDEVCDEIKEDEFMKYCYERFTDHILWDNDDN